MNKLMAGFIVIGLGIAAGWYVFAGKGTIPGMRIGTNQIFPVPTVATGTDVSVTTEDATGAAGNTKGGVVTGETTVSYTDAGYVPNRITVKKGTKVTFRNDSSVGMWTASGVHPTHQLLPGFDALKSVAKGSIYEYTFVKVGTWKYHNHVQPADTGIVTVVE